MATDRFGQGLGLFGAEQRRVLPHLLASFGDMSSVMAFCRAFEARVYTQFRYQFSVLAGTYELHREALEVVDFTVLDVVRSYPPSVVDQLPPSERRLFNFHLSPLTVTWTDVLRHDVHVRRGSPAPKVSVSVAWHANGDAFSAVVGDLDRLVVEWRLRELGCSYEVVQTEAPLVVWTEFVTEFCDVCRVASRVPGLSSSAATLASVLGVAMQMFSDPGPARRPGGLTVSSDLEGTSPVSFSDLSDAVLAAAPVEVARLVASVSASLAGDPFEHLTRLLDVVYDRFSFSVKVPVDDYSRDPGALTVVSVTADDVGGLSGESLPFFRHAGDIFEVPPYIPGIALSELDYLAAKLAREEGVPLPVRAFSFSWLRDGDCMSIVVGSTSARVLLWALESLPVEYTCTMVGAPLDQDFRFIHSLVDRLEDFRSSPVPEVYSPVGRLVLFMAFFAAYAPAGFSVPGSPALVPPQPGPVV